MPKILISESAMAKTGSRWNAKLIEGDKKGSSAFYPKDVLERDGARAFPKGTHIYFDHPTVTEGYERPERSVKDLVGVLEADAKYENDGLYAPVTIFNQYREVVAELAEHTGMSIRASGIVESEDIDGESVPVLKALTSGQSVDIVTQAGAGGKLMELLESARVAESPKPTPPKKEDSSMEIKELAALVESQGTKLDGLVASLTALTEAMKQPAPEKKVEESKTPSFAEIDAAMVESELPASMRTRVFDAVEKGAELPAAITAAKDLVESIRKDIGSGVVEGAVEDEGKTKSFQESVKEASALIYG